MKKYVERQKGRNLFLKSSSWRAHNYFWNTLERNPASLILANFFGRTCENTPTHENYLNRFRFVVRIGSNIMLFFLALVFFSSSVLSRPHVDCECCVSQFISKSLPDLRIPTRLHFALMIPSTNRKIDK